MPRERPLAIALLLLARPQYLPLIPSLLSPGIALAYLGGHFQLPNFAFAVIGFLLMAASASAFDDYTDWIRGTDKLVERTIFSGGSGLIKSGALTQNMVLTQAVVTMLIALPIGLYFSALHPGLIWIILAAAFLNVAYTPILTKTITTELSCGIGLGILPVWGGYFVMQTTGVIRFSSALVWLSLPVCVLMAALLWINEIPDIAADRATGRRHAVLLLGSSAAARGYVVLVVIAYASIVTPVVLGVLPAWCLLGLCTLPLAIKAGAGAVKNNTDTRAIVPALIQNYFVALITPILMAAGLLITKLTT